VIIFATKYSYILFNNPKIKGAVIEPEIKFIFLLLIIFMYFANLGDGHAVLPTFILGLFMGRYLAEHEKNRDVTMKLRSVHMPSLLRYFHRRRDERLNLSHHWSIRTFDYFLLARLLPSLWRLPLAVNTFLTGRCIQRTYVKGAYI
jgi:hypothetical protein